MTLEEVCASCIADVDALSDTLRMNRLQANQGLNDVRAKWDAIIKHHKGSSIAGIVSEARTRLPKITESKERWQDGLSSARYDFTFHLH